MYLISICNLYAPKRRTAFGLRTEREMTGIAGDGAESKIDREVQILPSLDLKSCCWSKINNLTLLNINFKDKNKQKFDEHNFSKYMHRVTALQCICCIV